MLLQSINLLCTLHKIQIRWLCMHAYFTFSTLLKKWIECWKGCFAVWSIQILGAINLKAYDLLFFAHNKLSLSWWKGWLHLLQFRSQYLDKGASGYAGKGVRAGSNEAGRISSFLSSCWSWNPQLVLWHGFSSQDNWVRWFSAEGWLYFKGFLMCSLKFFAWMKQWLNQLGESQGWMQVWFGWDSQRLCPHCLTRKMPPGQFSGKRRQGSTVSWVKPALCSTHDLAWQRHLGIIQMKSCNFISIVSNKCPQLLLNGVSAG